MTHRRGAIVTSWTSSDATLHTSAGLLHISVTWLSAAYTPLCCAQWCLHWGLWNDPVTMAALMACTLLRCCGDNDEQDDHAPDPGPPFVRLRQEQPTSRASSTRGQTPSCDVPSAQHTGVDELDADVLMLILARCELQDLALSARVGLATTVGSMDVQWCACGAYA